MSILSGIEPAINKFAERDFPIEPDFLNGWQIKLKGFRQIPIRYTYPPVDQIVKEYTQLKQNHKFRIMYLGPRHNTNLKTIRAYCQKQYDPRLKQSMLYNNQEMRKYQYSRQKEKDIVIGLEELGNRIFVGMNPTIQSDEELIFDSDFQCGNLDLVMKADVNEYDLFMKVDSNTKGHTSWYLYRIKNTRKGRKVKFNICNFHKKSSLYSKGMKPYMFSRLDGRGWNQANVQVAYQKKNLRYKQSKQHTKPLYCLTFTYQFQNDYDEIYFCYGIPYSYSYLMKFIDSILKQLSYRHFVRYDKKYQSASGLVIPVLTITNPSFLPKKVILITGRLHPGQTQGSWVLQGFINFLCSPEAEELRNITVFKIIPMVNVDGVIAGNFRTSLRGADLNRKFKTTDSTLSLKDDQVGWVKNLAYEYNKNIHMYLDFHGHSTNKNSFLYGPEYPMNHEHYFSSRLFPKIIDKETEMFRYYSCNFRISKNKQTTARAIMFKQNKIPFCFTIETSNHSYYSQKEGECLFTRELFLLLGEIIAAKQQQFMVLMSEIDLKKEEMRMLRKKKAAQKKETKLNFYGSKTIKLQMKKTIKERMFGEVKKEVEPQFTMDELLQEVFAKHNLTQIKEEIEAQQPEINLLSKKTDSESSDYESQTEDYSEEELASMFYSRNQITKSVSPELRVNKTPKIHMKKRSASYRLPPPEPSKKMLPRKKQPSQYKISPRTISIDTHNSQLIEAKAFLIDKDKIRQKSHRLRDLIPPTHSKTKIPSIRKIEYDQPEKSRQLKSENISVEIKEHLNKIQENKNQIFIYKHVKMLVFPQLSKQPASNKSMKGYPKKIEIYKALDSQLRKELIEKRGQRSRNARVSMQEIEGELYQQ